MDFGAMISNSPKFIILAFGLLMSIQAQLQDLGGHCGTPSTRLFGWISYSGDRPQLYGPTILRLSD